MVAWCYPEHRRVAYTYTDVKRNKQPAFTTNQVAEMLMRTRLTLEHAILRGDIERPQYTYGLNADKKMFKYMWAENNIMDAHAYFSTVHRGRPRKDGLVTPQRLPTARELRAMIRQEHVLYIRGDDGEFRPVWKAEDFN